MAMLLYICRMATEVRADPEELSRLAQAVLAASQRLGDGARAAGRDSMPARSSFGDTAGGGSVHAQHEFALESAGLAIDRLVSVLEGDVDRIFRVAFAYEQVDRAEAAKVAAAAAAKRRQQMIE